MKNIVTVIIFVVALLSLKAQTEDTSIIKDTLERNYYTRFNNFNFLKMDKIGDCNISFCVLGEVELDSLIIVNYEYKVVDPFYKHRSTMTGYFITYERNIPLIASMLPENLHTLIQRKDVFLLEMSPYVIKYSVAPQCSDTMRQYLEQMIPSSITFSYKFDCYGEKQYLLKNEKKESYITYRKYTVNKFLLLLMNRTWEESTNIYMYDPPHELDTTNTYVKYLIPLY
ncbi:MAG: hypothetical protein IKS33_04630 [Bacteroidales bacterium]|nr:hypothetical protein [Bacteroidales bacterium]